MCLCLETLCIQPSSEDGVSGGSPIASGALRRAIVVALSKLPHLYIYDASLTERIVALLLRLPNKSSRERDDVVNALVNAFVAACAQQVCLWLCLWLCLRLCVRVKARRPTLTLVG